MEKPERADIGDVVKIISSGQQYTGYTDFFEKLCPEFRYGYNDVHRCKPSLKNNMLCTVVFYEYDHRPACGHDMYVVEPETNLGVYYLVNEHAFEICETMRPHSIEIGEVAMSDLFEVISCR